MPTELPPDFKSGQHDNELPPDDDFSSEDDQYDEEPPDHYLHIMTGYNMNAWQLCLFVFIIGAITGFVIGKLI